jgi:hypothetical protein
MTTYEFRLAGCDDATVFAMDLTDAEADVARRIAALTVATSDYGCQPTMTMIIPAARGANPE